MNRLGSFRVKFLVYWLSVASAVASVSAADASVYDARLFSQVPVRDWIAGDRNRYLADVRAAGVDCVLASFGDMYAFGAQRAAFFDSLAQEIRFFEGAGVPVMVWTDTLGYGDVRTGTADGKARFGGAQPLFGLEGGRTGGVPRPRPCRDQGASRLSASEVRCGQASACCVAGEFRRRVCRRAVGDARQGWLEGGQGSRAPLLARRDVVIRESGWPFGFWLHSKSSTGRFSVAFAGAEMLSFNQSRKVLPIKKGRLA